MYLEDYFIPHESNFLWPRKTVVATGVFDVLTYSHFELLKFAKTYGSYLLVGINSDRSVKQLKGESRPIHNETQRAKMLESIRWVDGVIIFNELNVVNFLQKVKPNFWIKGNDYTLETLNQEERAAAQTLGVDIRFFPYIKGLSSSKLIQEYNLQT